MIAVSAGSYHSLVLCSDGTVAASGYNCFGQLGAYSYNNYSAKAPVSVMRIGALAEKTVVAVAAGYSHSLALCSRMAQWLPGVAIITDNLVTTRQLGCVPVAVTQIGGNMLARPW